MDIYEPQEDSFLLEGEVKKTVKHGMRVLDMGTGSGIQAKAAAACGAEVIAVDINPIVVQQLTGTKNITAIESNLFEKLTGIAPFDLIIFNPPYLPNEINDPDIALDGGEHGHELIERFLKEAKPFLKPNGIILLLFSSATDKSVVDKILKEEGYASNERAMMGLFMERIYVYALRR